MDLEPLAPGNGGRGGRVQAPAQEDDRWATGHDRKYVRAAARGRGEGPVPCPGAGRSSPRPRRRAGDIRWLASSATSPISPNSSLIAAAGTGTRAGRCSTRPSVREKVAVGDRLGRRRVHRSFERVGEERMMDHADGVVHREPADPLLPVAQGAAAAEPEGRQHPAERAAGGREHDAEAQVHDPDPGGPGRLGRRLPLAPQPDEEIARRAGRHVAFAQQLVALVAVDAHRGCRDQNLRGPLEPGQGLREQPGPLDPALADPPFAILGPPRPDVLAGQMDHRVQALEPLGHR